MPIASGAVVELPTSPNRARRPSLPYARRGLAWAGLVVSGVFAYLAVRHVKFADVSDALRSSNYWWLLPGLALLAVCVLLKAIRWRYLFARETRPPLPAVAGALLVGYFFNNVLPARAGEAARVVALNRSTRTPRAEIVATIALDRAYDVASLLVLLFVGLPWFPHVSWLRAAAVLAIVLTGGLVVGAVVLARYGERPLRVVLRPLRRLRLVDDARVELAAANLANGLAALRRPRLVLAALVWTTAAWLALAVSCWTVMLGFDFHHPFGAALLVVIAINLAAILPSSPAAVGVFEQATLVALGAYGVSDSAALPYALVLHVANFIPFVVVGLVVLHRQALRPSRAGAMRRAEPPA